MIKRIVPVAITGVLMTGMLACSSDSFKKTKNGLEYRIVKDEKGKEIVEGDVISVFIRVHVGDSVLLDSRKMNNNKPIDIPVIPPAFKGDWPEGLKLLSSGDSAVFMVPADSIMKLNAAGLPPYIKKGSKIAYDVKIVAVKSKTEVEAEQKKMQAEVEAQSAQQKEIDDKKLQEYFAQNKLSPNKTASGVYYIVSKDGSGATAQPGQMVTVNYTGKTLDGKAFDSNTDPQFKHVQPFAFTAGAHEVIPGWDEGIMLLKKGSKARLFIPSPLAYGPQSPGPDIQPNSILMFDVEITDIRNKDAAVNQ